MVLQFIRLSVLILELTNSLIFKFYFVFFLTGIVPKIFLTIKLEGVLKLNAHFYHYQDQQWKQVEF